MYRKKEHNSRLVRHRTVALYMFRPLQKRQRQHRRSGSFGIWSINVQHSLIYVKDGCCWCLNVWFYMVRAWFPVYGLLLVIRVTEDGSDIVHTLWYRHFPNTLISKPWTNTGSGLFSFHMFVNVFMKIIAIVILRWHLWNVFHVDLCLTLEIRFVT